jgi:ubiquinone/menaquinone biosynthesis C-methylase UbiE
MYDCAILTFTLQCVYDVKSVLKTIHRILKPGGVILITVPGISQIARYDDDQWGDYWRVYVTVTAHIAGRSILPRHVMVQPYGNVLAAMAGLHGLISQELKPRELNHRDRDYEVTLTARVVK